MCPLRAARPTVADNTLEFTNFAIFDKLTHFPKERRITAIHAIIELSTVRFVHGLAKVELALAKGRRTYDKRQKIADREQQREMDRARRR